MSRKHHKEYDDLAKLQMRMLKLFYVNGVIDWIEGTVKDIHLTTFAKGFLNLLAQMATVQET
jgi:hypothetical protein